MKPRQYAYLGGAVITAIAVAISGWNPLASAQNNRQPVFAVDPSLAQPVTGPCGDRWCGARLGAR